MNFFCGALNIFLSGLSFGFIIGADLAPQEFLCPLLLGALGAADIFMEMRKRSE